MIGVDMFSSICWKSLIWNFKVPGFSSAVHTKDLPQHGRVIENVCDGI
jgi:hypothetical protein